MGAMEWGAAGLERRLAPHTAARACAQARGGQFCGVMEWGVTGSSAPTAATSKETRHRVARARGQFREGASMGAMERDRGGLERRDSHRPATRTRAQARSVPGKYIHRGEGFLGDRGYHSHTACAHQYLCSHRASRLVCNILERKKMEWGRGGHRPSFKNDRPVYRL